MSLSIPIDTTWASWTDKSSGSGTITIQDGVFRSSGSAGNAAHLTQYIKVAPGEVITFKVIARRLSGSGDTSPRIGIDHPPGTLANSVAIDSDDWAEYSVSYSASLASSLPTAVQLACGSWTSLDGAAEYMLPRVEISNAVYGTPRVIARGVIRLAAGAASVNQSFVNCGLRSVSYEGINGVALTIPPVAREGSVTPLLWAGPDLDCPPNLDARAGGFNKATGQLRIRLLDMTTGAWIDYNAPDPIHIWFKAEV